MNISTCSVPPCSWWTTLERILYSLCPCLDFFSVFSVTWFPGEICFVLSEVHWWHWIPCVSSFVLSVSQILFFWLFCLFFGAVVVNFNTSGLQKGGANILLATLLPAVMAPSPSVHQELFIIINFLPYLVIYTQAHYAPVWLSTIYWCFQKWLLISKTNFWCSVPKKLSQMVPNWKMLSCVADKISVTLLCFNSPSSIFLQIFSIS